MVIGEGYVFIHIPKTGGTSITDALGGRSPNIGLHRTAREANSAAPAFCFVRNPFDWLVSTYCYNAQKQAVDAQEEDYQAKIRRMGFRRWLTEDRFFLRDDPDETAGPVQTRGQFYWWRDCTIAGRFEHLATDFREICRRLKIEHGRLGALNRRPKQRPEYKAFYDGATRAFVEEHHERSLEHFGYAFDRPHPSGELYSREGAC